MAIFGIFIGLVLIELILRIGGAALLAAQRSPTGGLSMHPGEERTYRILALGESTTAELFNGQSSWPRELEIYLNENSDNASFAVFNEGVAATNTLVILSYLEKNIDKYSPDIVVTMMGINDKADGGFKVKYVGKQGMDILEELRIFKLAGWAVKNIRASGDTENSSIRPEDNFGGDPLDFLDRGNESVDTANALPILLERLSLDPEDDGLLDDIGDMYVFQDDCENALAYYEKADRINSSRPETMNSLLDCYTRLGMADLQEETAMRIVRLNPDDGVIYFRLGNIYASQGKANLSIEMFEKAVSLQPQADLFFLTLGKEAASKNETSIRAREYYQNKGFAEADEPIDNITAYHYRRMHDILKKRQIKYIAMQYPTLQPDNLADIFLNDDDVTIVSNMENFREALQAEPYRNLFRDRFGGSFGHATKKGNVMIAENLGRVILDELNLTS